MKQQWYRYQNETVRSFERFKGFIVTVTQTFLRNQKKNPIKDENGMKMKLTRDRIKERIVLNW